MTSPALKTQAASLNIQPSTTFSKGHWPTLISPLFWSPWYRGLSLVWDAADVDTFFYVHYKDSARQAGFTATIRLRLQNSKNIMTSKAITTSTSCNLDRWCLASPPLLFWVVLQRNLFYMSGDPRDWGCLSLAVVRVE